MVIREPGGRTVPRQWMYPIRAGAGRGQTFITVRLTGERRPAMTTMPLSDTW